MSTPQRRPSSALIERLVEQPHRFEFFQAVRLIERWLADSTLCTGSDFDAVLLPAQLHFRNSLSLSFAPAEIESLSVSPLLASCARQEGEGSLQAPQPQRLTLTPAFMGLLGISGTLPLTYTEKIYQLEATHRDSAMRSFLDIFTDRAVALFYAAWKKSRLQFSYESKPERGKNPFTSMLLMLAGLGPKSLRGRLHHPLGGVHDESLAFLSSSLQQRNLSAQQLAQLLSRYFGVPVQAEQFHGRWYTMPEHARWHLGALGTSELGTSTLIGQRMWQRDLSIKLTLGPLDQLHFQRFLPGAPGRLALRELLTTVCGVGLNFEINLCLAAQEVRGLVLDSQRPPTFSRLGWDTYVQTTAAAHNRCDLHFDAFP
jgi:type VI secretion system protein ImpH